jgi:hypothetical protein
LRNGSAKVDVENKLEEELSEGVFFSNEFRNWRIVSCEE